MPVGELAENFSRELGAPTTERKGPSTFWHQGTVGGPFRPPGHGDLLDSGPIGSASGLEQSRGLAGAGQETKRNGTSPSRSVLKSCHMVNWPSAPISKLPVPIPPRCIRASTWVPES